MADELVMTLLMRAVVGGEEYEFDEPRTTVDIAGNQALKTVQSVPITEEALELGDVATQGYVALKNLDPTNYISYYGATGETATAILRPGKWAVFEIHPDSTAPRVKANEAACRMRVLLLPD